MNKEQKRIKQIGRRVGLNFEETFRLQGIGFDEAVEKYIPLKTRGTMIWRGHYIAVNETASLGERVKRALGIAQLFADGKLKRYFLGTGEGEKWYRVFVPAQEIEQILWKEYLGVRRNWLAQKLGR
jgi:hypothetical protein